MSLHKSPDVLVIGAGVIGLATAFELLRAGLRVTVLERGTVGRGSASWAGGGILAPLHPADVTPALAPLLAESLKLYPEWCRAVQDAGGIDPEFERSGLVILDSADEDTWRSWADAHEAGPASAIAKADLGRLSLGDSKALFVPGIAQVRSPRLLQALAAAIRAKGGQILEGAPVRKVLIESERVRGVQLESERMICGTIVLAAGAWSSELSTEVEVEPVRGQMLLFRTRPHTLRHIVLRDGCYLIPRRDGMIVAGSTLERVGFDGGVTEEGRGTILSAAMGMMPPLGRAPIVAQWSGLRPASLDGVPRIRWSKRMRGLLLNSGHHRLGITLAPASARRAASAIAP